MFPDRKISKNFTCGKTKCSYILCHGIATFVKETLLNESKEVPYYTAVSDKSYNKIYKKRQMDLHVHFWDDTDNKVKHFIGILSSWVKLADDVFS